ncbi:hypothetical protein O988_09161 [Pseudogymnoascus sp. VKM F-3808]|nr:hypothetical protein O988_09161 [Pseudogymnoascus sp. VKM F-3808]
MRFSPSIAAAWLAACVMGEKMAAEPLGEVRTIPLRTHTLTPPYLDTDMQSRWWDFGGDTIIRTDKYVRLTSDRPSRDGWIWSRVPLTATNWEIEFEFQIDGAGNLHGDGMAMWLTRQRNTPGPVFGSTDMFEGLGIFFDTYKNNRPGTVFPYIMAMIGDGTTPYDKAHDGKDNEYAGCSARGIRGAAVPTKARLKYFQDKTLRLDLQYKTEDEWILCFEKSDPPMLPSVAYLGFSAETGELSDNHDIISVTTKNLYTVGASSSTPKSEQGKKDKGKFGSASKKKKSGSGGWMWFFFKVFAFFAVIGGAYVGFTAWRTQSKRSHRF